MSERPGLIDMSEREPSDKNLIGYEGGIWQIMNYWPGENQDLHCGWLGGMDDRERRPHYTIRHVCGPNPIGVRWIKDADPRNLTKLNAMQVIAAAASIE